MAYIDNVIEGKLYKFISDIGSRTGKKKRNDLKKLFALKCIV